MSFKNYVFFKIVLNNLSRFGKRMMNFSKKAPMRFGKRAPMRWLHDLKCVKVPTVRSWDQSPKFNGVRASIRCLHSIGQVFATGESLQMPYFRCNPVWAKTCTIIGQLKLLKCNFWLNIRIVYIPNTNKITQFVPDQLIWKSNGFFFCIWGIWSCDVPIGLESGHQWGLGNEHQWGESRELEKKQIQ